MLQTELLRHWLADAYGTEIALVDAMETQLADLSGQHEMEATFFGYLDTLQRRGSAARRAMKRRPPCIVGSSLSASTTALLRTTVSAMIRLPRRESVRAHMTYSGVRGLSASMKIRSKGPCSSAASRGSVSSAHPRRNATTSAKPARDVGTGGVGVLWVGLQRDQAVAGRQRPRGSDGAIAAERIDLGDGACSLNPCQIAAAVCLGLATRCAAAGRLGRWPGAPHPVRGRTGRHEQIAEVAVAQRPFVTSSRRYRNPSENPRLPVVG